MRSHSYKAQELFELLNAQDECPWIEAKGGSESSHSVMETVCAFSNEPGLGGGYILMGIAEDNSVLFPQYKVSGVSDPDKFQKDFSTQCAGMFNLPVRPEISIENIAGKTIIKVCVHELPTGQKPVYFKNEGLPFGAMRRIGSTDQHCTEDDMHVFYQDSVSYDQTKVKGTSIDDIDESAIERYRSLRKKVNPVAEELDFNDSELLQALGCVNKEKPEEMNIAGVLLFGSAKTQRQYYPMLRVDYIRVPGNTWVQNPDDRFTTIDMRGPIILMLYRLIDAINADLPRGFLLQDDKVQAESTGLPLKALREAIVNALMHRSYREHRPTQVIRYDNRIEITNPGFSLKSEEQLGQPGSETRNPFIAAVFHDTNLAETKGSGIRAMRRLMVAAHMVLPTFESSRENNEFTVRLLLHHFLDERDLAWLQQFEHLNLSDPQKEALIFVREVGAIDNQTYRQMADCDTLRASTDLRALKNYDLLKPKGKGKATYYIPGDTLSTPPPGINTPLSELSAPPPEISAPPPEISAPISGLSTPPPEISAPPAGLGITSPEISTPPSGLSTPPPEISTPPPGISTPPSEMIADTTLADIPEEITEEIKHLKQRVHDVEKIENLIKKLCNIKPLKSNDIAQILGKREDYIKRKYLGPMISKKELRYLHPEMINHPEQAYLTNKD